MDGPKDRHLQRFFEEEKAACFFNIHDLDATNAVAIPTKCFNLVHQLVHIHHHFFYEDVEMRQLMDYYFLLQSLQFPKLKS